MRYHARLSPARAARRSGRPARPKLQARTPLPRLRFADRKSLLLGTALASTLFIGSALAPKPAHAVTNCLTGNPPPGAITTNVTDFIICINVDDRFNMGPAVIKLQATGGNHYIDLLNSGILTNINPAGYANGLAAATSGGNSLISVTNAARILVDAQSYVYGITVGAADGSSPVSIVNSADIMAKSAASTAVGLEGITNNGLSPLSIVNSGDISVTAALSATALTAATNNGLSPVSVVNRGDLDAISSGGPATGISVETLNGNSPFSIVNSGAIAANAGAKLTPFARRLMILTVPLAS